MSETTDPSGSEPDLAPDAEDEQDVVGFGQGQPADPAPILVSIAPAARQARLTVAFRAILAIPHYIVLFGLSAALSVVGFIGWWAALFTGQLPDWAFSFMTGVLRWWTRVHGYLHLLTDQYPPFDLEDADYPIRLVTKPTRLNRLAVLFRIILVLPAWVLTVLVVVGGAIIGPVAWLITLVAGRLPVPLHQAFGAVLRFQIRTNGYYYLLTPEYPRGLFGDRPDPGAAEVTGLETAAGDLEPEPDGLPAGQEPALAPDAVSAEPVTQVPDLAPDAAPAAPDTSATEPVPDASPGELAADEQENGETATADLATQTPSAPAAVSWRLTVAGAARGLIILAIVLGVGAYTASIVLSLTLGSTVTRAQARANLNRSAKTLEVTVGKLQTKVPSCGSNVSCVTAIDGKIASAFADFGSSIQDKGVPAQNSAEASALVSASNKVASDFRRLTAAKSVSQYQSIAAGLTLQDDVTRFEAAGARLQSSLSAH
jgi:hypothetical protein